MPNKRDLKLDDYGISGKRYKELCGYCEQYPEWKEELEGKKDTLKSKVISDMPASTSGEDATVALAIRRSELKDKCEVIEQSANQASAEFYQYIIKSVTEEVPLWYLRDNMKMPYCATDFYAIRRYFFYILDQKKK